MKFNKIIIPVFFLCSTFISSCEKEQGPLSDIKPAIQVTVTNAMAFRPEPTVSTSVGTGGNIQIILSIPASSGRTIREITRIATNTSYAMIQGLATPAIYYSATLSTFTPISVNSTSYTFNTTLTEYVQRGTTLSPVNSIPPANSELARRFYFLLTLDDGSKIIPEPVRVLVL